MTPARFTAPLLSAAATASLIAAALWMQHARGSWPFERGVPETRAEAVTGHEEHGEQPDRVGVDAASAHALDIRLETVRRESLTETVPAAATVMPDESRVSHVHTRVAGWVERLDVSTTGETVRAGQPLARIFSQELLSSQTEYLAVRRATAASGITSAVVASGRTRLSVLGMTADEIDAIEASGEPARVVTIVAPRDGIVINRGVTAGTSIDPATTILTIADLSRVWVLAEVPEGGMRGIAAGTLAQLDFPGSGLPPFAARVEFVSPTLTPRTRTLQVRLSVANPKGTLRPGLYGTAAFTSTAPQVLTVARDAVVDTGLRQHVFVASDGRYEPRVVTIGVRLADRVEVRGGLKAGEQVVAAGVFLLDSESRLRATGGAGANAHAGHQR
jgi:Cu(I)/Ag(I) efflux system membrane fusion protein